MIGDNNIVSICVYNSTELFSIRLMLLINIMNTSDNYWSDVPQFRKFIFS